MNITIVIPHFKTGKMTAYSVAQWLKFKGQHNVTIIVGDNNVGDGSIEYLKPFEKDITLIDYPKGKLQSHGILIDYILSLGIVKTDYFITAESDSFPIAEGYLNYYEAIIREGYDLAGSILHLSGGTYLHPCGAVYSKKLWEEAKQYCDACEYVYFPNAAMKESFACHLMVHSSIFKEFCEAPDDYVEASKDYKNKFPVFVWSKQNDYKPVVCVFHNGMGTRQETLTTYGQRTIESEKGFTLLDNKSKLIYRMGLEPGQWLTYYAAATDKKMFAIPTEVQWLPNKENQQQEYTINEAGVKHLWGISAYHNNTPIGSEEIAAIKQSIPAKLYDTLPEHQKIKSII